VEKYCVAGQATGDSITRRMGFACRLHKATNTQSEYVMLIAFPLHQLLYERYRYIACRVLYLCTLGRVLIAWNTE